ncbi:hypothetical protein LMG28138_02411 [Pararobbsia alpina]|uniref:Uncharacterized protein n=1 Tax=Pararobbsia alpina TaxID=621374 RepID=A0A6S7B6I4_9BURK|nr:hypothetical protein LMG28138_02411 [Pararobbsia alpina]
MEQNRDNSIQSTVQLAVALGRLHDVASQLVNAGPRDRDDTITVSRQAFNRLQDQIEQNEQLYGLPRDADQGRQRDQEWQGRQRGQQGAERQQAGSRDSRDVH